MSYIHERILEIERLVDTDSFTYKGERVWPIIRISMYLSESKSTKSKVSFAKAAEFAVGGIFEYVVGRLQKHSNLKDINLFITTSHFKVRESGSTIDKIIQPILEFVSHAGQDYRVWEFTGNYSYDGRINYRQKLRKIQKEVYLRLNIQRIFSPKNDSIGGEVAALNSVLEARNMHFRINREFSKKLDVIFKQAEFFKSEMVRESVRRLFVVCYYDIKGFSAVFAANKLGIPVIDLQHGVQGANHMGYAQWPSHIANRSPFLPSHFFVWNNASANTIRVWKEDIKQVLIGCNKWILDRVRRVSNDIILVSLQPIANWFPDLLLDVIRDYRGSEHWYIRLHPTQHHSLADLRDRIGSAGVGSKVNLEDASFLPLHSLLERTKVHLTAYSSVAVEASYYGIPTYFWDPKGPSYYEGIVSEDLIYHHPKDDMGAVVAMNREQHVGTLPAQENSIDVLEYFIR